MERIPDAPWIREAEQDGMPGDDPVFCPCCRQECEWIYTDGSGGYVIGCEKCIDRTAAVDWWAEHREDESP